jgi:hypothetical protein
MNIISQAITTPGSLSKEEMADQIVSIITNGGNLAMFAIGAFIGFMGLLLSTYITVTKYNLIAESMAGKKMSIFGQAKANAWPYTAYVIVMCILMGVIFVPGALAIVLGPTIAKLFGLLLLFLGALALIIIAFTFQFAIWELLIARKGPVESIKASFALVRSNLKKVFVFDLAYWAGAIGLSLIFSALQALVQFVGSLFMMLSPIAGILVYVGAYAIVLVIESAITGATLLVFSYMFWKKVRG